VTAFTDENVPGRFGATATTEADPREVGRVRTEYSPAHDGDPDPGEIVWTWVPFEENDGRGKDRPVLVVAREAAGTVLAVQLSSKRHDGDREWVPIGSGPWDRSGRDSWVDVDRVLAGEDLPRSRGHLVYVAFEIAKALALVGLGVTLLAG